MGGGPGPGDGYDGEAERETESLIGKLPAEASNSSSEEEHLVKRTGTVWTAMAHIVTAVIGSGVLSLAWSVAQLGWVGGPVAIVFFAGVTAVQSCLLADCYMSHDPERGVVRNKSYVDAVRFYLGEKSRMFCAVFLNFSLFGTGVVYTLTSATSMRAIQRANCYHREGHDAACSAGGDGYYMLAFGLAQVALSLIPDFHNMAGLSVFAAAMSFFYSVVGVGLGVAKVIKNGLIVKGGIGGIAMVSTTQKVWRVSQALGDIAFAYPFTLVLLEIEDTLKSPPPETETMKRAAKASILTTTFFYLSCGCIGYAAFGDATPGNLLTGFGFYEPYWLIDLANLSVVLHLLGGYQVYTQPVFAFADSLFLDEVGARRRASVFSFRLCFRTAYVAGTTALAVWFPYFNQVVGLLGAFTFWPLGIHLPVEMYLVKNRVAPWTRQWLAIKAFSAVCLLICVFASVGSAVGVFGPETS